MTATPITTDITLQRARAVRLLTGAGSLQDLGCLTDGLRGLAARLHGTAAGAAAELEAHAASLDRARDRGVLRITELQQLADRLAALATEGTGA